MIFRSRKKSAPPEPAQNGGGVAIAEEPEDAEALLAQVDELLDSSPDSPGHELSRRILALRHRAGIGLIQKPRALSEPSHPDPDRLPGGAGLPEVDAGSLDPELLRAAILEHGSLLVRDLVPREDATRLAAEIEKSFGERAEGRMGALHDEFEPAEGFPVLQRSWLAQTNAMWLADSPQIAIDVLELFRRIGLREMLGSYLGEPPVLSLQKSTLRKVNPDAPNAWHQDGAFMGEVRAVNIWLSLTRCGDEAPGLDIVPRRVEEIIATGTEGAMFDWSVAPDLAEQVAGDSRITRPIFEPGDALLFDDLCLHNTAADPRMPNPRYAVETWFFGPSAFPEGYAPLAL